MVLAKEMSLQMNPKSVRISFLLRWSSRNTAPYATTCELTKCVLLSQKRPRPNANSFLATT